MVVMSAIPSHHTSIRQTGEHFSFKIQNDSPLRPLDPDMVLVKTVAVSVNPCDVKSALRWPVRGTTSGAEFAGYVVALGSSAQQLFRLQDRVCGVVHGSYPNEPDIGAFGEYVTACEHALIKIPNDMPWENAAAIALSGLTSAVALFHSMGIPATPQEPATTPFWVLVWGGATACGTMAIQLLKLYEQTHPNCHLRTKSRLAILVADRTYHRSGIRVIATSSPKNFNLLRRYGADHVVDYNSPSCATEIREHTSNRLKYVLDTIAEARTITLCYRSIGRLGGTYLGLEQIPQELIESLNRKTVTASWLNGFVFFGRPVYLSDGYGSPAHPEYIKVVGYWSKSIERLLFQGKLMSHPPRIEPGGLEGVIKGLELKRQKAISGQKLVYFLQK